MIAMPQKLKPTYSSSNATLSEDILVDWTAQDILNNMCLQDGTVGLPHIDMIQIKIPWILNKRDHVWCKMS